MERYIRWVRRGIRVMHLEKWLLRDRGTREMAEILYRRQDPEKMFWKIWCRRILAMVSLLLAAVFCLVVSLMQDTTEEVVTSGGFIQREDEAKTVTFGVETDTAGGIVQEQITLKLGRRKFTDEECKKIEKKADSYIKKTLCGENASLDQVKSALCFPKTVPDTGVQLEWQWEEKYVDEKGNIRYEALPEEGAEIVVSAKASWNNWEKEYFFPVTLVAAQLPLTEVVLSEIRASVETAVLAQSTQRKIQLPEMVSGQSVRYVNLPKPKDLSVVYLVLGVLILLPVLWKRKQKEALEQREQELMLDYPELVNKVMLLLRAGLTVRGCFERIGAEYGTRLHEGGKRRYVYEEVCYSCQEMKHGMTETKAIENFGKRCRQLPYLRFASLLTQNIRKGSEGLTQILEAEAMEAFEKRKETVKQMGEKAGTKLLLPMILMLGIVMAIIIIPAFMTM